MGVTLCSRTERFERADFFAELLAVCESAEYRAKLEKASRVRSPDDLAGLGNRIEALHSVPTAIASFAFTPESFEAAVSNVIFLGGDTDTLVVGLLESSLKGREYIRQLAERLLAVYDRGAEATGA